MAGHSQFKNIMYRKSAQDSKKAKVFSKISREITVAVKEGGDDIDSNSRLRFALLTARAENMPKDNVDRAIKKALGNDGSADYQSVRYEGYGPSGVAVIVEGLTDNKNRTASAVRSVFSKFGGSLGESNSVSFQFDHVGWIFYKKSESLNDEKMLEISIESGADDMFVFDEGVEIICSIEKLSAVREALTAEFGDPEEAKVTWKPKNTIAVSEETSKTLYKLIDSLEEDDDVQCVFSNHELAS